MERTVKHWTRHSRRPALSPPPSLSPANAADISGAGATFPYPIYAKWADAYKKETGIGLNYQSIGSGGGIKQIQAKTVTFGATDAPLKGEDLEKHGLVQFPTVMGGIVPVVNRRRHQAGRTRPRRPDARQDLPRRDQELERSGDRRSSTRASSCRTQAIAIVHRSDGSGTTFNFANYLVGSEPGLEVQGRRQHRRCSGRSASAPRATKASPTTSAKTKGSIGYVEYAYAKQNKLTHTKMINKDGKAVAPTAEAFQAAAANADWKSQPGYRRHPDQPARRRVVADDRLRP